MLNNEDLELPGLIEEHEEPGFTQTELYEQAMHEELEREEQRQEELVHHRRPFLSMDTILRREYSEQEFLIGPAVLPKRGKMLITAETGVGKSAITMHIAACLATGTSLFNLVSRKHDETEGQPIFPVSKSQYVTYLDYEIPEQMRKTRLKPLYDRFKAIGKDPSHNLTFFQKSSDYRLMNLRGEIEPGKGSFDKLFERLRLAEPGVFIVDPFSSTHSLNEISNEIKQPLNNLDRIIDHSGCAVILIHHASTKQKDNHGKPTVKRAQEQPRGHSSILDWCDSHLHISDASEGHPSVTKTLRLEWGKMRYGPKPMTRHIVLNFETMDIEPFNF